MFIWDKGRHPDFNAIQDIGQTPTRVFTFRSANTDYPLGSGILRPTQVDYSYDGSPSLFMSRPDSVVGGFSTNEPFIYRTWAATSTTRTSPTPATPTTATRHRPAPTPAAGCAVPVPAVPILQRGMIDFMAEPAAGVAPDRLAQHAVRRELPLPASPRRSTGCA